MRETEFWARMESALGPAYAHVWADQHNLAALEGRTVRRALGDAEPCKVIWRAVWTELGLPDRDR